MSKKTLARSAATAMLLTGSLVTALLESASACTFDLVAPDGTRASYVYVDVDWQYSSSGASVKPSSVTIYNFTGRSITLNSDRWQNSAGTTVQRGLGGQIPSGEGLRWFPTAWIPKTQNPYVGVSAYATTRKGMGGSVKCRP